VFNVLLILLLVQLQPMELLVLMDSIYQLHGLPVHNVLPDQQFVNQLLYLIIVLIYIIQLQLLEIQLLVPYVQLQIIWLIVIAPLMLLVVNQDIMLYQDLVKLVHLMLLLVMELLF